MAVHCRKWRFNFWTGKCWKYRQWSVVTMLMAIKAILTMTVIHGCRLRLNVDRCDSSKTCWMVSTNFRSILHGTRWVQKEFYEYRANLTTFYATNRWHGLKKPNSICTIECMWIQVSTGNFQVFYYKHYRIYAMMIHNISSWPLCEGMHHFDHACSMIRHTYRIMYIDGPYILRL